MATARELHRFVKHHKGWFIKASAVIVMVRKNPSAFLDANHKPEMAIALTPFTALCGWRWRSSKLT